MEEEQRDWRNEMLDKIQNMIETNEVTRERWERTFGSMDAVYQRLEEQRNVRRVKYREELLYAYSMWSERLSQAQIHEGLEKSEHHEAVSLRTVSTWLSWFKEIPFPQAQQDRHIIMFHSLEDWDIPFEKYSDLMELTRGRRIRLTPRTAKWMVRLQSIRRQGRPALTQEKVMQFTKQYVEAEQLELMNVYNSTELTKASTSMSVETEMIGEQNES